MSDSLSLMSWKWCNCTGAPNDISWSPLNDITALLRKFRCWTSNSIPPRPTFQEIGPTVHPRFTDPVKTWASNSSIATYCFGVHWDSVPLNFWWKQQLHLKNTPQIGKGIQHWPKPPNGFQRIFCKCMDRYTRVWNWRNWKNNITRLVHPRSLTVRPFYIPFRKENTVVFQESHLSGASC